MDSFSKRSLGWLLTGVLLAIGIVIPASAQEIDMLEQFALAKDRAAVLAKLIPGTEEYFYYHTLHYQNTDRLADAEKTLKDWIGRHNLTQLARQMMMRQMLLAYNAHPNETLAYFIRELGVQLNHELPATVRQRQLPSTFDQQRIDESALIKQAIANSGNLGQLTHVGLLQVNANELPIHQLRELLTRYDVIAQPQLVAWIAKELSDQHSQGFGAIAIHHRLTLDQLKELQKLKPDLIGNQQYVNEVMQRLRPAAGVIIDASPEVEIEYRQRLVEFTRTLPSQFISLRVATLYHLLDALRKQGRYDADLFLEYVKLPREVPYLLPQFKQEVRGQLAQLNEDFSALIALPPILNDEPLVRDYLQQLLRDANSPDKFAPYLETRYLQKVFVETKILFGIGESLSWFNQLNAAEQKELRERVELDWVLSNSQNWSTDAPVRLDVDVKNIERLSVRVFRINLPAYFQQFQNPVNTDIDLDGLVAAVQWEKTFDTSAWLRHRETIDLKTIDGAGVWIVELVGGGRRSRAIVSRGDLRTVSKLTPAGHQFTVFDTNNRPVSDAKLIVAGQELTANAQGEIIVPYVDKATDQVGILISGNFAKPLRFHHAAEQYGLKAGFYVHRESLQAGRQTTVLLRASLTLHGHPVSVSLIRNPVVIITATDLDGSTMTQRFENVSLFEDRETEVEIRVPSRLHEVTLSFSGDVRMRSQGRDQSLSDEQSFEFDTIRTTSTIYQPQLTETKEGYYAEITGHSGELSNGFPVQVKMWHRAVNNPVDVTLGADAQGRVHLGKLAGITRLQMSGNHLYARTWTLDANHASWPDMLTATAGETLTLPIAPSDGPKIELPQGRWQLIEVLDNAVRRDLTNKIAEQPGAIKLPELSAGDYELRDLLEQRTMRIVVDEGSTFNGLLLGDSRSIELVNRGTASVSEIKQDEKSIRVHLDGATKFTRVHLLVSRYTLPIDPINLTMPGVRPSIENYRSPSSGYVSNLRLDDEYRYVLERQLAKKYPGNMLPQPSLLMNPWDIGASQAEEIAMATGDAVPAAPMPPSAMMSDAMRRKQAAMEGEAAAPGDPTTVEYLRNSGMVVANAEVDDQGWITIDTDAIDGAQMVTLVVVDPLAVQVRRIPLDAKPLEHDDLRLASSLPVDKPLTQSRTVMTVKPDAPLEIGDVQSARAQIYANVGDLYRFYAAQLNDETFNQFAFLTRWHTLDDEAKQAKYDEFASHELHLFVYFKDRPFFDRVVKPMLNQKKDLQFMDDWLLGHDLNKYVDLWRFDQLNTVERALLSARLESQRGPVQRIMADWLAMNPVDPSEVHRRMLAAISGKDLSADELSDLSLNLSSAPQGEVGFSSGGLGGMVALSDGVDRLDAARGLAPGNAAANRPEETKREMIEKSLRRRSGDLMEADKKQKASFFGLMERESVRQLYREIDQTKRWAESNYYHLTIQAAGSNLVPVRTYWKDLANAENARPAVSQDLFAPIANANEALLALAVVGLPLKADGIESDAKDGRLVIRTKAPAAVVTEQIREVKPAAEGAPTILLGHRVAGDEVAPLPGHAPDAIKEFVIGKVYHGQVVLSNPTDQVVNADLLVQIPAGSLPLEQTRPTDSHRVQLEPYSTQRFQYAFYFPVAGKFSHYGPTASQDDTLLARADSAELEVLAEPSEPDENSWPYLVQHGTAAQIAAYLKNTANLYHVDLQMVAPRMSEPEVFQQVTATLDELRHYDATLWGYSLKHNSSQRLKQYFAHRDDVVSMTGPAIESPLLLIDPIEREIYEHIEFRPLEVPRRHPAGGRWQIPNAELKAQWNSLMRVLAYQSQPKPRQQLALTYFLLLQQRIEEAINHLQQVDRASTGMPMAYDYLVAYSNLYQGRYDEANRLAGSYTDFPTEFWRTRFDEVRSQVREHVAMMGGESIALPGKNEVVTATENSKLTPASAEARREQEHSVAAARQPTFDFRLESSQVQLKWQNLQSVEVNYYLLDVELLFTRKPFVQEGSSRASLVQPNETRLLKLSKENGELTWEIPNEIANRNVLVEIVAGSQRQSRVASGGNIAVTLSTGYGHLQTNIAGTSKPIVGSYVKVYAKLSGGQVQFWKDGYTDLRGRFDYASVSGSSINSVERFAILVLSSENGAVIREAEPPR